MEHQPGDDESIPVASYSENGELGMVWFIRRGVLRRNGHKPHGNPKDEYYSLPVHEAIRLSAQSSKDYIDEYDLDQAAKNFKP